MNPADSNTNSSAHSEFHVNEKGQLCEVVDFGSEKIEYRINGITEHIIFGIYFSFNERFEY